MKIVCLALLGGICWAQNASQTYMMNISMKVAPDKQAAFTEFYKTGLGSKSLKHRLATYPEVIRWTLLQAVYPGDPAPEANFLLAAVTTGPPNQDAARNEEIARAGAGMSYAEYMTKVRSMSEVVGSTLSHLHDVTTGYALADGDYAVVRRLKIAEGKTQERSEMSKSIRLPLAEESIKAGNMKGWAFSHLTFPGGSSLPYDASEVYLYKDLATAVRGPEGGGGTAAFAKLFPGKNYTAYIDSLRAASKVVRTDLYRVVVAYRK